MSVKKTIRDIPVLYWMLQVLRFSLNPKDRGAGIYALSHKEYGERRAGKPLSEKAASSILKEEKTEGCPLYERMTGFLEACPEIDSPEALYSYFDLDSYIHPTSRTWQEDRDSLLMLFQTAFETLPFHETLCFMEMPCVREEICFTENFRSRRERDKRLWRPHGGHF